MTSTTLLAATGLSPAVVTETLWALAQEKRRVLPARVIFITTLVGAEKIQQQLFTPLPAFSGKTVWEALRFSLNAGDHELIAELPRVIGQANKKTGTFDGLSDITTPEHNELAAAFILEQVRQVVANPDTRLVASIAGGRKTMGALLHAAITLIGRETDRLTHVLVDAPYETMPGFFFPDQPGPPLKDRDGKDHPAIQAGVHLADLPFVPLRNRFEDIQDFPGSFDGLRRKFSRELKEDAARPHLIEISYRKKTLWVDDKAPVKLRPKLLAVLHYLLWLQEKGITASDQAEAAEGMNRWLKKADFIPLGIRPAEGSITDAVIRHELSDLRKSLAKVGNFMPNRFGQDFQPFTLRLRD